jgi:TetR/AcrR family transcriptional regulator, transcriptional repressor of aconitase
MVDKIAGALPERNFFRTLGLNNPDTRMPKIIDHDAYRDELAHRAMEVFRQHGYNGVGMRGIAEELGISKSALYHYFPGKQELFIACARRVGSLEIKEVHDPIEALVATTSALENDFEGELRVLLDYLGGRSAADIREDRAVAASTESIRAHIESIVGKERSDAALTCVYGIVLRRWLDGKATPLQHLRELLARLL